MKGQTHQQVAARDRVIVQARRDGASVVKLALQHGLSVQMIYQIAKKVPKTPKATSERDLKMASMHKQGLTLEKIGQQFNLTRERVRQILQKQGIKSSDGGFHVNVSAQRIQTAKNREARCQLKYGFAPEEMAQYRSNGATKAFREQRRNAGLRNVAFRLTFRQWITLWESSGKFHLRGKGIGKYCMSRIRDDGCYEVGNVHIQLCTDNSREAVEKWRGKVKQHRGVFNLYPGTQRGWRAVAGGKTVGYFGTEQEAAAARAAYMAEHNISDSGRLGAGRGYTVTKRGYFLMQAGNRKRSFKTAEEARAAYLEACAEILAERASAGA